VAKATLQDEVLYGGTEVPPFQDSGLGDSGLGYGGLGYSGLAGELRWGLLQNFTEGPRQRGGILCDTPPYRDILWRSGLSPRGVAGLGWCSMQGFAQ